ncbi:hypothetical protein [Couchioplanes caeruleus]|uniref:Lipoprotein n=2 Tax=Couchioplanes caeruleus TaxID=56438 RepID=A0A1K0G023_9ACTN|nr:hypothetical protein [Couchioplanes caeruleus]OJF10658.1 hypothetical protein BG844_30825 [Couchioplanes caeruleus subsp. caeruleus]ROP30735.1 hypothetical protein EDD30_3597 [Couchioplanes caeruleus]
MSLFRTATATSLVVVFLTACSATDTAAPGNSVPVTQSAAPSALAASQPAPSAPPADPSSPRSTQATPHNSVATGPPPGVRKPPGIPKTPTDIVKSPGWTEGWITRGGTGPCYGFADVDGKPYAVYSDAGTPLMKGAYVRVRLVPSELRINCGEGTQMQMEAVEQVP